MLQHNVRIFVGAPGMGTGCAGKGPKPRRRRSTANNPVVFSDTAQSIEPPGADPHAG
jgi:hypothetical protein